jgi:DNA-directed RNA polymerase subunit M/transcription elongation factor TFIIS
MSEIVCPKCTKKEVAVRQAKAEKGDVKYYECKACHTIWTNSIDIAKLPVEA